LTFGDLVVKYRWIHWTRDRAQRAVGTAVRGGGSTGPPEFCLTCVGHVKRP